MRIVDPCSTRVRSAAGKVEKDSNAVSIEDAASLLYFSMRDQRIAHPTDPTLSATYGWDHTLGYWVEIKRRGERPECIDFMAHGFDIDRPLWSVLEALASRGFFDDRENLEIALFALEWGEEDDLDADQKRVIGVVEFLKKQAGVW